MTELALGWLSAYGIWVLGLTTLLSCLAAPVPSSLMMLTAGGFVASGDLTGWAVVSAAFVGAVIGDQIGFSIGRRAGKPITTRLRPEGKAARMVARASEYLQRRGAIAVFLTRWLISPLGPYVNLVGGASGLGWLRFSYASILGEMVWVGSYVTLGFVFADRIIDLAAILGNASGTIAAGTVTILLGFWLRRSMHRNTQSNPDPRQAG
jgi:membrane protein DedA with SNARE-associated domain